MISSRAQSPGTRRRAFLLVLLLLAAAEACRTGPPAGVARVVQFAPGAEEVSEPDLAGGLRVVFDRPLAPPEAVGRTLAGPAFAIEPPLEGEARWLDRRTLAFFPRGRLRASTAYRVGLDEQLATAAGARFEWRGVRFVHQRVEIEEVGFAGSRQFQPRVPLATVRATMAIRPADAMAGCAFHVQNPDGKLGPRIAARRVQVRAEGEEAPGAEGASRVLRLRPAAPLTSGTAHVFRCDGAFRPPRASEGLAPAHETRFATAAPAAVKRVGPSGSDVSADEVKVEIVFATPMDPGQVRRHVRLTRDAAGGEPVPIELAGDAGGLAFAWTGDLEPGTDYTLTVGPGLKDTLGQALDPPAPHTFSIGDASPRLRMERGIYVVERASGRYPIWTRNLAAFRVRCAAVPEAKLASVLTGPANYDAWWDASGGPPDYAALGLTLREQALKVATQHNQWMDRALPLRSTCGGGPSGVYLLEVSTEGERHYPGGRSRLSLANVTDLGLLAKVGNASSLVWVVRLSTGQPVPDAEVKIRDLEGKVRFSGRTDRDGVVVGPGASKLLGVKPRNGEEDGGEWEDYRARRVIVTAQASDDLAVLDTNWNNGIQIWNFGVDQDRGGGSARVRGFLHSDRGLYRPGDTVHLRGLVRRIDVAGKMSVPRLRKVRLVIEDPRGRVMVEEELVVSAFGGFSRDLALAAEAPLGDYQVRGEIEGQRFSERFAVEEYRPRTFEVKVDTPKKDVFFGQRLTFSLAASYLYGSPLREGKATWSVRRRARIPSFPGFEHYAFQDRAALWDGGRPWAVHEERSFSDHVADGELPLDAAGKGAVTAIDPVKELPGPHDYVFQVSVQDKAGDEVTAGTVVGGHKADLYLGLHASEWVQAVNMPFGVQVVAFDSAGQRRAATARVTLTRRTYDCSASAISWGGCQRASAGAAAVDRTVTVPAAGTAAVQRVSLGVPGEYLVRVTAADGRGNEAVATDLIYVIGEGEAFWSGDEGDRMTVIASRPRYRPGETARLVPQAQMPGALALVTLERDGVLSHATRRLATSGQALEVPIEARLAPNVFASVVLVRGRTGEGQGGRPRFRIGMVNLVVESDEQRLRVAVETDRPSYEPGELVKARVKVTGSDGAPVRGELALAVADEGVLQIVNFKTPDPLPVFYAPWGLGVESSTTWNRFLSGAHPENSSDDDDEEAGGDGGGEEAGRIRSRFMATAFWAAALTTDAGGRVEVSFRAPDNLTAFRVMAVVADAGDRFGAGERRFTVRKPLQAVPALPRFLTVGDEVQAAVVLHNNTGGTLSVVVSAAVEGLRAPGSGLREGASRLASGSPSLEPGAGSLEPAAVVLTGVARQSVELPAGGLRRVAFPVAARAPGQAAFTFRARGGDFADAVLVKLPVASAGAPEVLLVGEGATTSRVQHPLPALGTVVPGRGALEVTVDATGLGRLEEGLRYLIGYPYGCLEQTTSRVVPMIALGELSKVVGLEELNAGKARPFIEAGIAKILRHQHPDGGFGLWPGTPPELHYTAYGLWGLHVARSAGYQVDGAAVEQGVRYLQRRLQETHGGSLDPHPGDAGAAAFALYVLAALGGSDPAVLARQYEWRQQLPLYGRAFLARALHAAGRAEAAGSVAGELAALVAATGPAILREGSTDLGWYWSSDTRTTALVLSALLEVKPGHPAVAQLADGLLGARVAGRWASTQENLYSLLALAQLARARAEAPVTATVALGGQVLGRPEVRGRAVHLRVPLAEAGAGPLVIESEGGRLFYAARLHVERPLEAVKAAEQGITIERAYLDPESGQPVTSLEVGQTVKVRVTLRAAERQSHVAVVDRLPAGVEPVLTRFQPTLRAGASARASSQWHTLWQNEELRDDRAHVFADVLGAGESSHEYLVRAVAAGTFAAAPATAEAMYRPQVRGQTAAATLVVLP
jgi:uncharacterized protein YfaS (alpha-2-macroglobulin family)